VFEHARSLQSRALLLNQGALFRVEMPGLEHTQLRLIRLMLSVRARSLLLARTALLMMEHVRAVQA
jgi:hypothetical protein